MRPPGAPDQLAQRRRRAVQLLQAGQPMSAVARQMQASVSSVWRWWQTYQRAGPRGLRPTPYTAFERTWAKRCPGVVTSLREGGDELLTFFSFPRAQWKTLRTTNIIERLHEEFRRRVKTQSSLPSEDAAVVLLFSLVASGQIKLRKIDGWRKITAVLCQHTAAA